MGTKRELAPVVAGVVARLPTGPCLDLFAGMCSVAGAISSSGREIWCNDLQKYAALVAESLIGSTENRPSAKFAASGLRRDFDKNMGRLADRWCTELEYEIQASLR